MIINIRGTSGSGKTTLVRKIMEQYGRCQVYKEPGRRQPIGYVCREPINNNVASQPLAVIGHYETACGGCDTIQKMDHVYELVRESYKSGYHVLYEGLLLSAEVNRAQALHDDGFPLCIVGLDQVPLEVCLDSVNQRRMDRLGPEKFTPVKEKNTKSKFKGVQSSMRRFQEAGVRVESCDRDSALELIMMEFNLC